MAVITSAPVRAEKFEAGTELQVAGLPTNDRLNLRASASSTAKIVEELPAGITGLIATGRTAMNGPDEWIEVKRGKRVGWLHSRYLVRPAEKAKVEPVALPAPAKSSQNPAADCNAEVAGLKRAGCAALIDDPKTDRSTRLLAYSRRSDAALALQNFDEAVADREIVFKESPGSSAAIERLSEALRLRAKARREKNEWEGALKDFTAALEHDPVNIAALAGRASLYIRAGAIEAAAQDLLLAQKIQPENDIVTAQLIDLFQRKAHRAIEEKKVDEAIAAYGSAIGIRPTADLYIRRGIARVPNDAEGALADFSSAIGVADSEAGIREYRRRVDLDSSATKVADSDAAISAYQRRAEIYVSRRQWRDAAADFAEVTRLDPKNLNARLRLAFAAEESGDTAAAADHYKAAQQLKPENKYAKQGLARIARAKADQEALANPGDMIREEAKGEASFWGHNGSTMRLTASGASRKFYYEYPRDGLTMIGVKKGTLLFNGSRSSNGYKGTARSYSSRCGTKTFAVSGDVGNDGRVVTLYGKAPNYDESCQIVSHRDEVLVFTLFEGVE